MGRATGSGEGECKKKECGEGECGECEAGECEEVEEEGGDCEEVGDREDSAMDVDWEGSEDQEEEELDQ